MMAQIAGGLQLAWSRTDELGVLFFVVESLELVPELTKRMETGNGTAGDGNE